jgi:NitT/TauT family transport system permease protein
VTAAGTDAAVPLPGDPVAEPELFEEEAVETPERGGRVRHAVGLVIPPLIVAAVAIGVWYFATYVALDEQRRFLLPAPHAVIEGSFVESGSRDEILTATLETGKVAFVGLAIASILGIGIAVAMSQARWVERSLFPWAVVLQTVPILAIVPLIGFWWGFDFRSRVLVCVLISLFPMITNTLFGLRSAPQGLHDLFSLRRASRWTRLRKLEFPAALPAIFVGLQISAGLSVIGAIVGDFFFRQGDPGIGRLIDNYRAALASEELFGAIIASSLLGVLAFTLVGVAADRVVGRWHESGQRRQ